MQRKENTNKVCKEEWRGKKNYKTLKCETKLGKYEKSDTDFLIQLKDQTVAASFSA